VLEENLILNHRGSTARSTTAPPPRRGGPRRCHSSFGHSSFVFHSGFWFRYSGFCPASFATDFSVYNPVMLVRPTIVQDVPAVVPMVRKIAAFHQALDPARYAARGDVGEMYQRWLGERAGDERSVFLVAEQDVGPRSGDLAGFLIASVEKEIPIYILKEFGLIHDLWVEEEYRNEGLARQMVTLAIERFTQMGVSQIRLHAAWANAPARTLFERCGFRGASAEMLLQLESK
jgi:ribosomal protein S18 acetylase RimI-like enzyme